MPIRWSALKVSEAASMIAEYVNRAAEPLEQARIVAREACKIDNLPQYVEQDFARLIGEIVRAIGGSQWDPTGRLKAAIQSIRESLPDGSVEDERKRLQYGSQQSLV